MFDTCGSGYFVAKKGFEPDAAYLQALLVKGRVANVKIATVEEVDVQVAAAVFELSITGLG